MWSLGWIWSLTPTQELDEKLIMDSHAASYTGVLDSFFAAAITAHLMLEDWSFEPFNLWLEAHPLLLQWYHQQFHSQLWAMKPLPLAQVPLAQALQQQQGASLAQDFHKSPNSLLWPVVALAIPVHLPAFQGVGLPCALQTHSETWAE